MRKIYIILITIALSLPALADYHYASHTGSNTFPYTNWETAADSIQKAINATTQHDTVFISSGDWLETVQTGEDDSIAIIGMGMDSTFWYGDSLHTPVLTIDYGCFVEGITFRHLGGYHALFGMPYAGVTIRDCRFRRSAFGIDATGGHTEITNCIFDTLDTGIHIYLSYSDIYIANNLFRNMYGLGGIEFISDSAVVERNIIFMQGSGPGIGGSTTSDRRVIRNNIIISPATGISSTANILQNNVIKNRYNGSWTFGILVWTGQSAINNSVMGCRYGMGLEIEGPEYVQYNHFWENYANFYDSTGDTIGNLDSDPMYISADSGDFRLQAFSPLIDAGDPNILDYDGSRSDIGAYGGTNGAFYEYLDLPPEPPDSISGSGVSDTIFLSWRMNTEADFNCYLLHRDTLAGFIPSPANLIAEPETSFYADANIIIGRTYYYRIAAIDNQGNQSEYSPELRMDLTDVWDEAGTPLPRVSVISSNYPNPFNSATTLVYSVANLGPIPAEIEITIYDIMGRKVRTLQRERKDVGVHRVIWNGKDDAGSDLSSGMYFAKITQWGIDSSSTPKKIILMR